MTNPFLRSKSNSNTSQAVGIALSYTAFLFVALLLALFLYLSSLSAARESFWQQESAQLKSSSATMNSYISTLSNYTHQLNTDSTLMRLSAMDGAELDSSFVYAAWQVMQNLNTRNYGLLHTPAQASYIYLKNSGYVISSSQFTEGEQYYRAYRSFAAGKYETFLDMLYSADDAGDFRDASAITGSADSLFLICSFGGKPGQEDPAAIWFELDTQMLTNLFIPSDQLDAATLVITDNRGSRHLVLGRQDAALVDVMENTAFSSLGTAEYGSMKLLQQVDSLGWTYTLALPLQMCDDAVDPHSTVFLLIILLAVVLGVLMIIMLVHRAMRPLHQLTSQLTQAEDDKAQLQREIDAQKPLLSVSYVRKLLSGHVASQEEFSYMMEYLGLSGEDKHFYVLYCIAHRQDAASSDPLAEYDALTAHIDRYLTTRYPVYYYTTLDRSFVVLVAYDNDQPESLNDLQHRVMQLHDSLSDEHGLWFYAGVGGRRTQAIQLWESYEQARNAARYTARHHIFLPYEFIQKDADSWYYPIEISAKLLHFITTGNHQQVSELLALIHKENVEERSLSVSLLTLLLSDLKNTLFKARFQIPPPQTDEARAKLDQLDELLHAAPTFHSLESNALALCSFFVKATTPSNPIPEIEIYLQENYADPSLCLSKLGERFNISESYLSHQFKDRTGVNFSVYLERLRMEEAARRLRSGVCSLSTLYADLGYTNAATFRRAFKKYHGITPSEMRDNA
ncbi:MAG: helix-turn-helix domain-containing protein [Clostridia bacterium]|nr:helix-turn-helix domain-containing protein [Clostridia bacterium]